MSRDSEEFPVNLDDVWPLVYSRKDKAVRALQSNDLFLQNVDYQVLPQNGENSILLPQNGEQDGKRAKQWGGNAQVTYMLSVSCLEFFIARKVRPVFEVYRQVFPPDSDEFGSKERIEYTLGLDALFTCLRQTY